MKNFVLGLIAVASLSTAALASPQSDIDARGRTLASGVVVETTETAPLLVIRAENSKAHLTAYERMLKQSAENANGGK